jgi:membrane dipeptidase
MSYYLAPTEEDPLLPKTKGAPEIQGSRPQSINHELIGEDSSQRQQTGFGGLIHCVIGILFFVLLFLTLAPEALDDFLGDRRPTPKTLEERVDRILTDTPLIGWRPLTFCFLDI